MSRDNSHQNPITIITPIIPGKTDDLKIYLAQLKVDLLENKYEDFETIGTIHFLRWFLINDKGEANNPMHEPPMLVLSSNFDGDSERQIQDLCTTAQKMIDKIYEHCVGYPAANARTIPNRVEYLISHNVKPASFYRGSPNRSLLQIRGEFALRNFLRKELDENSRAWSKLSAVEVQGILQKSVNSNPDFLWAQDPFEMPKVNIPGLILLGLVLLILSPLILILILIVEFGYERHDKHFTLTRSQLNDVKINELEAYEDLEFQNQFTQLVVMKKGGIRLFTFKFMMKFSVALIKWFFVKGKLMGMPTIHFARWVLFDNNKRVMFMSNFDGSWQQYLGDFIDKSGWGLTGIFSNTTNFPKAKFLVLGGAYDEEHFLAWSRNTEIPTQVWYNAYPKLSIKNVNNNSQIRSLLFKNLPESKAQEFLKLL